MITPVFKTPLWNVIMPVLEILDPGRSRRNRIGSPSYSRSNQYRDTFAFAPQSDALVRKLAEFLESGKDTVSKMSRSIKSAMSSLEGLL